MYLTKVIECAARQESKNLNSMLRVFLFPLPSNITQLPGLKHLAGGVKLALILIGNNVVNQSGLTFFKVL
jgi:hypothetical protein